MPVGCIANRVSDNLYEAGIGGTLEGVALEGVPFGNFDFGGTIEEIKARCKQETHLDPPVRPTFS
jgi:hypothetical protein